MILRPPSKEAVVLDALRRGERLTVLTCLDRYRTTCLSQRVSEWRAQGIPIADRIVSDGRARYKEYWMEAQG